MASAFLFEQEKCLHARVFSKQQVGKYPRLSAVRGVIPFIASQI